MFRRDGYLSILDLDVKIRCHFEDILGDFVDGETIRQRVSVWVAWHVRMALEETETLHLCYPGKEPVPVDAHLATWSNVPGVIVSSDIRAPKNAGRDELRAWHKKMTDGWEFIDYDIGEVRVPTLPSVFLRIMQELFSLGTWWQSLVGYKIRRHLKPFRGYFVCIRQEDADTAIQKLLLRIKAANAEELSDTLDDVGASSQKRRVGRPRKSDLALSAYRDLWPSGSHRDDPNLTNYSWKSVCRILEGKIGQPVSEDVIQAALKAEKGGQSPRNTP